MVYWRICSFCFVCATRAKIFTPPAIRLNIKNNQNNGIRKKGSCSMPCASTSEPIMLNAIMQTTAPRNRRTPSQNETRIILFIFFFAPFSPWIFTKIRPWRFQELAKTIGIMALQSRYAHFRCARNCTMVCPIHLNSIQLPMSPILNARPRPATRVHSPPSVNAAWEVSE